MDRQVLLDEFDHVLVITINRPEVRNAINGAVAEGLASAMAYLDRSESLRVGVLTGAGSVFCAGMDLKEFARYGTPKRLAGLLRNGSKKPLIAAIEGCALAGGLELALICDILVSTPSAKIGIPEAKLGLFAAGGGLLRLPRHLSYALAAEMAFTGEPISGETAHRYGLVNRLADPGHTSYSAVQLAQTVASNAPSSLVASKLILREMAGLTEAEFWDRQAPLAKKIFNSRDAQEGARSFAEKRQPKWTGT
jgi:enoyl-CoA hydratase